MTGLRVVELVDEGERPLTVNAVAGMHRQAWAKRTREIRHRWWALALESRVPRLARASIVVTPLHKDRRSPQDVAAAAPAAKAAIDGLVDACLLPDDNPAHLIQITFKPPEVVGFDGLRLRIVEEA